MMVMMLSELPPFLRLAGLQQLVFFAEHRTHEAQVILNESTNPKRYFPFAAAGELYLLTHVTSNTPMHVGGV